MTQAEERQNQELLDLSTRLMTLTTEIHALTTEVHQLVKRPAVREKDGWVLRTDGGPSRA